MARIETRRGLQTLLKRYLEQGVDDSTPAAAGYPGQWISTIEGCLKEGLAMDETDYENTPKELRPLWRGLR